MSGPVQNQDDGADAGAAAGVQISDRATLQAERGPGLAPWHHMFIKHTVCVIKASHRQIIII